MFSIQSHLTEYLTEKITPVVKMKFRHSRECFCYYNSFAVAELRATHLTLMSPRKEKFAYISK